MIAFLIGSIARVSVTFRGFPTWVILVGLSLLQSAAAEISKEAVLLEATSTELRFRTPRHRDLRLSSSMKKQPKLGQTVSLRHHKGQLLGWEPLPAKLVQGRLHSLNVGRRRLSLKPRTGKTKTWDLAPHHVLFKELKTSRLYSLHRGELLVGLIREGHLITLFDAQSYLVRELTPGSGELLAWGRVTGVDDAVLTCLDHRTGTSKKIDYGPATRWQLGAIFRSPEDFRGSDCLIFGDARATLVISRRAFPFILDKLLLTP